MRIPNKALLREAVGAYKTSYGMASIVGVGAGVVLALALGNAGWLAAGLVPAALIAPLKAARLRRVMEQQSQQQIQQLRAVEIPKAAKDLDGRLGAVTAAQTKHAKQLADSFERTRSEVVSATAAVRRSIRIEAEIDRKRVEQQLVDVGHSVAAAEQAIEDQVVAVQAQTESYRLALEQLSERLGDDRRFDTLAGKVAHLEPEVERFKRLRTETAKLVDEVAELAAASGSLQTRLGATRSSLRSEFALFASQLGPRLDSADQLVIILSPQRSGTTLAFDALRSLSGCSALAANDVYLAVGAAGNRYPWDLLQDSGSGQPITMRDGVGGILPLFGQSDGAVKERVSTFVEKVHPSSVNFDSARFLAGVDRLGEQVAVQLVLLVRDPADAAASFLAYQERGSWHSEVEPGELPALYHESFRMITEVMKARPNSIVLDYADIRDDSFAAFSRVAAKTMGEADRQENLRGVLAELDQRTRGGSERFFGKHIAPSGIARGRLDIALSPLMADAQTAYANLQESNLD